MSGRSAPQNEKHVLRKFLRDTAERVAPRAMHRLFIARHSPHEPELALLPALAPTGALAVDIGANRGLYVHHLLTITNRVVAFDPLPAMQVHLRRIYGSRIALHGVALSDQTGAARLRFPAAHPSLATIASGNDFQQRGAEETATEIEVATRRLDDYALSDVAFAKIDVEGHEEAVLRGAARTLEARPTLLVECEERHCAGAPARLRNWLTDRAYRGFFVAGDEIACMGRFRPERDQCLANISAAGKTGHYVNNFIFLPEERCREVVADMRRLLRGRA